MLRKLSVRIAVLICVLGPAFGVMFIIVGTIYLHLAQPHTRVFLTILQLLAMGFGVPLLLGLVISHFVAEPIREFTRAIAKLRESDYAVKLAKGEFQEFDALTDEFNQLTQRLAKEEELRSNLISDASHELNTPLAALAGQVKGMQDGVLAVTPERLRLLGESVERLTGMVAELQDYANIRSHAIRPSKKHVSLATLADRLHEAYAARLAAAGMALEVSGEQSVTADPGLLEQLVGNLVENAIAHSGGTAIRVVLASTSLTVTDNGRGISKEHLPYIFERFYRVDSSRSRETGGFGLGLAIVKEIAEAHGWRVSVRPEKPGTSFVIAF